MAEQEERSASPYSGLAGKIRPGGSESAALAAATPPRLRLIRAEDQAAVGEVLVDERVVAHIAPGETSTIEVPAGKHVVTVRIIGSTASAEFEAENGETIRFQTLYEGAGLGVRGRMRLFAMLMRPTGRVLLIRL